MRFRLLNVLVLAAVATGVFVGVAQALDFDEEDPAPPHAEVGMVYSYEIGTHAGCLPHRLVIASGALPPGLSIRRIDLDTHVVEGVATEAGTFSAWIQLLDCDNKSAETLFTFDVWPRRWGIATAALKAAAVGSSTFTVKATAKEKNFGPTRIDSKQYTLNVLAPLTAKLSRNIAEANVRFSTALLGAGGQSPYTWSATGVPAGLAIGPDGVVSGVPARSGSFTFTARIVDANGTVKETQVRLVVRQRLSIATKSLPAAAAGRAYRAKISSQGGVEGKRWTSGALPRGLKLGATTGAITGVPASAGTFRITVRVRDALGAVSQKTLVLR